ncbi:MAG: hypothetical protein OXJ90_01425 [Spirochaetaceae bacterium]|nr:hypothetical protein [Spirochaetaceae bacterium]
MHWFFFKEPARVVGTYAGYTWAVASKGAVLGVGAGIAIGVGVSVLAVAGAAYGVKRYFEPERVDRRCRWREGSSRIIDKCYQGKRHIDKETKKRCQKKLDRFWDQVYGENA